MAHPLYGPVLYLKPDMIAEYDTQYSTNNYLEIPDIAIIDQFSINGKKPDVKKLNLTPQEKLEKYHRS